MSFYFTKKEHKSKSAPVPKAVGAITAATLRRLGCRACPLDRAKIHTPKMKPTLVAETLIYFLGEGPGADEDINSGKPFTGPSGRLLRSCIPAAVAPYCSFDNVVNCRPEGNRTPVPTEVHCCAPRREQFIQQAKPKLIVGVGGTAAQWALKTADLIGLRGRLFAIKIGSHACWFMPTYHPSFLLRTAKDKKDPLRSRLGHCFKMDIKRACQMVTGLKPPQIMDGATLCNNIEGFDGRGGFERLTGLLAQAQRAPAKAIDLETRGLRPYASGAAVLSAALSFGNAHLAFAIDHPQSGWSKEQRRKLLTLLKAIVEDDSTKIAHNAPFEIEWLGWLLGRDVVNHTAWECTQMQAHFLDERKSKFQDEDTAASRYQG